MSKGRAEAGSGLLFSRLIRRKVQVQVSDVVIWCKGGQGSYRSEEVSGKIVRK
jgi:hypothetical protein